MEGENENETTNTNTIPVPERLVSILDDNYQEMIDRIPLQDVRNFCFIAHVDHGKSSLSSRLLEITGNNGRENQKIALESARNNINALDNDGTSTTSSSSSDDSSSNNDQPDEKEQIQLLDTLAVERERGITVKASAASMLYPHPSAVGPDGVILLNCVDTPGHSDFSSEVARSLSFVQGAVLLLDAAQGIQAQTWTVYEKAKSMTNPPEVILALTKIDLGKLYEDTCLLLLSTIMCVFCVFSLSLIIIIIIVIFQLLLCIFCLKIRCGRPH
jgi:small GTP-binding protein